MTKSAEKLFSVVIAASLSILEAAAETDVRYCVLDDVLCPVIDGAVRIPKSVKVIPPLCFRNYRDLRKVIFTEVTFEEREKDSGVTEFGNKAFENSGLEGICIPKSTETLGERCFSGCENLKEVTFKSDSRLKTIGKYAFENSGLKQIRIPKSVKNFGESCFANCRSLREVTFEPGSRPERADKDIFANCCDELTVSVPSEETAKLFASQKNCRVRIISDATENPLPEILPQEPPSRSSRNNMRSRFLCSQILLREQADNPASFESPADDSKRTAIFTQTREPPSQPSQNNMRSRVLRSQILLPEPSLPASGETPSSRPSENSDLKSQLTDPKQISGQTLASLPGQEPFAPSRNSVERRPPPERKSPSRNAETTNVSLRQSLIAGYAAAQSKTMPPLRNPI
ncbi:MAG: leucine-rich repeat protein [Holosporaceae bacterium]|jgi:hypothetical protein|nr:leucine-rich repeat protein [Holosporaceae bacterium]